MRDEKEWRKWGIIFSLMGHWEHGVLIECVVCHILNWTALPAIQYGCKCEHTRTYNHSYTQIFWRISANFNEKHVHIHSNFIPYKWTLKNFLNFVGFFCLLTFSCSIKFDRAKMFMSNRNSNSIYMNIEIFHLMIIVNLFI